MKCWDKDYLVTVDYYSNFWEIENTLSSTIINKLRSHFSRHGIPDIVFSDNGPQFDCSEFRKFASLWEFKHETSSSLYPQSNGKVKQAVKTAKQQMRKAIHDQKDPYLAILDFRNTPTQGFNTSPAQRLMNRRTNTVITKTKFIATEHCFSISCAQRNATTETETTILLQSRN